ncbi:MAG: hypothetical protein DI535_05120 [Citrobacter freundii]|nr:MAG: hypothetical protein DI535_05120 [Citrobacter freundii]
MKLLLCTAAVSIALLSFAGNSESTNSAQEMNASTVYQDTLPKKDTSKKHKKDKRERRDTMYQRY